MGLHAKLLVEPLVELVMALLLQRLALVCVMQTASWVSPTTPLGISGSSLTLSLTRASRRDWALQLPWMDIL